MSTSGPSGGWTVVEITTEQTHAVRRAVLRQGTPTDDPRFDEDDWPGVVHLGAFEAGVLVGTSTWVPRSPADRPSVPAVQLRGMASLRSHQGRGVGGALLVEGCRRAVERGAELVWANARDTALGFYRSHGFAVVGDGFVDPTTQLPHHVVERRLT
ncbi:MAG: GNAT family N-acetyltransferase [Ilumatobacteraceae bacterium]